ncbi:MAG: tRNA (adenosine(37)-N6)-threonylcarbamoyltransferase complex transferase subunit TsaD [Acidobacteriia bacterium]|nr:tRNA (adenosine(37)-N6)-threonylcarbamoyltransferase complex transferase subunit TsaD [Terriglobia bacterium]
MLILGIESSCDETAAAVVENGVHIRSNVIASQVALHRKYGGVVPELAAREHVMSIGPTVRQACEEAGARYGDFDAIAVTQGPGLVGSLLVGISYAKAMSMSMGTPLVAVNHIEGHIYAAFMERLANPLQESGTPALPALALVVSGGHTSLFLVERHPSGTGFQYQLIGRTRDDAAGEAYDKVAKLLGLGYPGGPVIDRLAPFGNPKAVPFTKTKISDRSLDFSFSGIKTAALRYVQKNNIRPLDPRVHHDEKDVPPIMVDLVASFQRTVVEILVRSLQRGMLEYRPESILLSGGVAANSELRSAVGNFCAEHKLEAYIPPPYLTTDNAAMISAAGHDHFLRQELADLDLNAEASLQLAKKIQ